MTFIKTQFVSALNKLSYFSHTAELEQISLKYITFMANCKDNSPMALTKLKQIRNKSYSFSFFFYQICFVIESKLVEAVKVKHLRKNEKDFRIMSVDEIWRLETVKDEIVRNIGDVLKKKIKMWENLMNGETNNLDKLIKDVLAISKQVEISNYRVNDILDDFENEVQRNYTFYHKYQSLKSLFFDSDYRKAASYQRKMEEIW